MVASTIESLLSHTRRVAVLDEETFLEEVPIADMFMAPYSRAISSHQLSRMMKVGFDRRRAGIITLSMRPEGRYAIVDGSHRKTVAQNSGQTTMLARVFIDLSYEDEARLYEALNTIKPPTALDRFRAKVEYRDPVSLDIVQRLQKFSLHISSSNPRASKGSISAVGAIEHIYATMGPAGLSEVIRLLFDSWEYEPLAWNGKMISGVEQFWSRYRDLVNRKELVQKLQLVSPAKLLAYAGVMGSSNGSTGALVGRQIVATYNQRKSAHKLPEWNSIPTKERTD